MTKKSLKNLIKIEWSLVLISSILLGIWAVKDTIALRNILLVSGALTSGYYIFQAWSHKVFKEQCTTLNVLPIIFLGLAYLWIILHYVFFSIEPTAQMQELRSTWLRALMASILGLGTGLALRYYPNRLYLLWFGIFIAFIFLICQYLPRALSQKKLMVLDYDYYLFHLKINTVLMGTIMIAGINGALWDHLGAIKYRLNEFRIWYLAYWIVAIILAMWAFIYAVNSRSGVGLTMIFYFFWIIFTLYFYTQIYSKNLKSIKFVFITFFSLLIISFFGNLQNSVNSGWKTLVSDVKFGVQIDRYQNWQDPAKFGYPKDGNDKVNMGGTYERVAWAVAGSRAIIAYPQGVGLLEFPFTLHPNAVPIIKEKRGIEGFSTHSGWVELGLAFGIPLLSLIFIILFLTFVNAISYSYPARNTAIGFVIILLCLYTVGEVAVKHGVEILFYFLALLPALLITRKSVS